MLITNDLLYSNYISNYAWFGYEKYSDKKIIELIYDYNQIETKENNYMRENFADTFFSGDTGLSANFINKKPRSFKPALVFTGFLSRFNICQHLWKICLDILQ